ncbi:hypothetical protein Vretimale_12599 [Volvox reticuliferus]|uniref:Uncharacterized protein n=1 Tax=Volvox reticuliferus TaxID=1737510 RepID=A0A8J4GIP5_9CHLO|nr:hypothetical protein Vretifemale_235 [Volvox reticuliferus]GIM08576.1 hypothetical protein Vretimale_12599 [Volvox reticuliferus]
MNQYRLSARSRSAADGRQQARGHPSALRTNSTYQRRTLIENINTSSVKDARICSDGKPATKDSDDAASFSGRAANPQLGQHFTHGFSLGPAATWRAMLATAASACVLLPGSFLPPSPSPLSPESHAPPPASPPPLPVLRETLMRVEAALLATPGKALAADLRSGAAAARMDAVRQLASPDVRMMQEVSEELATRVPPPGADSSPAAAVRGVGEFRSGGRGPAAAAAAAAIQGKANAPKAVDMKARLQAADLASLLAIPITEAKSLMASERDLGQLARGSATQSFDTVRQLLGLGPAAGNGGSSSAAGGVDRDNDARQRQQAGRVVARQPRVLLVSAPELRDRFSELQSLLSAPAPLARRLVLSQPGLLTHSPAALRSRLSGLCSLFNVEPSLAAVLASHHPGLLAVNGGELAGRAGVLAEALKLSKQQTVALLRRQPRALLVSSETLRSRLRALTSQLELPSGEALGTVVLNAPRLLVSEEGEVERGLKELQGLLQISRDRAVTLASEHPVLLVTHGSVLQERLRTLADLAQLPLDKIRPLVLDKPSLLAKSSSAMRKAVAEVEEAEEGRGVQGDSTGSLGRQAAAASTKSSAKGPWWR